VTSSKRAFCSPWLRWNVLPVLVTLVLSWSVTGSAQTQKTKKVMVITDMEGVSGIFDFELQCIPWKSPRWEESHKLLTGEINAAVDGLLDGGATDVVVLDGHTGGSGLSVMDIHPKTRLITGLHNVPSEFGLDSSYSAMIFVGQHAMSGAQMGILAHTSHMDDRNVWVNNIPVGEFGLTAMVGAWFGVPTIMLSGDTAACKEVHAFVPQAECAEVKSGFNATSGIMLSHPAACALIREKARRAMQRLSEFKPYKLPEPAEIKIQLAHILGSTHDVELRSKGAEELDDWTFVFRGRKFMEAWKKSGGF